MDINIDNIKSLCEAYGIKYKLTKKGNIRLTKDGEFLLKTNKLDFAFAWLLGYLYHE